MEDMGGYGFTVKRASKPTGFSRSIWQEIRRRFWLTTTWRRVRLKKNFFFVSIAQNVDVFILLLLNKFLLTSRLAKKKSTKKSLFFAKKKKKKREFRFVQKFKKVTRIEVIKNYPYVDRGSNNSTLWGNY